jgi:hypothetical protein
MSDLEIAVKGVKYNCRSDGTAIVIEFGQTDRELVFPGFIDVDRERYIVKEISGFRKWNGIRVTIANNVEKIGENCFCKCKSLSEVIFESGSKLKEIGKWAFCESDKELVFPGFIDVARKRYIVKEISGFGKWNGIRVTIANSVEKLGEQCFFQCESLSEVIFESESKLKEIGNWAFCYSGLESIRIPNNIEKLGEYCFWGCNSLSEVIFESGSKLKEIGRDAFCASDLKSIRIPKSVEKLGDNCFR